MRVIVLSFILLFTNLCGAQGLFEYFKLTADDDGPEKFDRIAVDFNWDSWLNTPENIKTGNYSIGVNAYWYKDIPLNPRSTVALAIGLGVGSHNVHHNGQFLTLDSAGTSFTGLYPLPKETTWRKNKYTATYLDLPLELRFRNMYIESRRKDAGYRTFRFYPGFKFGVLVNDHTKWRDDNIKYKIYNLKNTNWFRYGVTARLAFGKIAFTGYYSLTPLFQKGKGEQLTFYSLGISWIRF